MNRYKILFSGKIYATSADNIMDAEDKFIDEFGVDLQRCPNILVELISDDENINMPNIKQF